MRILFTHSYFLHFDEKQWKTMQPYAPLGTLFAASFLRENGYEVALHDVMFLEDPKSITPVLASFKPDMLVIYDDGFNYLTKMCLTNMREAAFEMSAIAKSFGCTVAISSSDSTDHFNQYLDHSADYIMLGEAEHTLLEIANGVRDGNIDAASIKGIAYRDNGKTIRTMARPVLQDLDSLPLPAWDLADLNAYKQAWINSNGYFSINMTTTRGCPYKCNWCAKPIYGNRYNARTPENVFAELQLLYERYHFDHIWFCDDIFGLKPGWVKRFAALLNEAGIKIRFKIQSRADLILKDRQAEDLAAAGCETVWMGAESGSQKILDAMDKGITVQQIEEAVKQLNAKNIRTALFLQFGYLQETKDDIRLTLAMLRKLMPDEIGISVSYPLPGTKFYEKVKEELKQKTNWTDSDEMAMMFHGTYEPDFYKKLHRYVHTYYRQLKNTQQVKRFNLKAIVKMPLYALREKQQKKILEA